MTEQQQRIPFGGQAVIEGVMIRGPRTMTIAVRGPDGQIITKSEVTASPGATALRRVPYLRGILILGDTLSLGIRSLYWSARAAAGKPDEKITRAEIAVSAVTLTAAAAAFIGGPVVLTNWVGRASGSGLAEVGAEGLVRIGLLLGYIGFVGRLPEVQRVFAYHGAEHRAVHAHEHGQPLTVENVRAFANEHPRCGTAFLLTVGVASLGVFAALGTPPVWERIAERVILTPVIAALAYEFVRASQAWDNHPLLRFLQKPNLWLQKMTTRDPDDAQIEVAIAAMAGAIAAEAALPAVAPAPALANAEVEADEV